MLHIHSLRHAGDNAFRVFQRLKVDKMMKKVYKYKNNEQTYNFNRSALKNIDTFNKDK